MRRILLFIAILLPVAYRMDWSDVAQDRRDVVNAIAQVNREKRLRDFAGLAIGKFQRKIYFQLRSRCADKAELAQEQIDIWRAEGLDLPRFERIPDPIYPSTDTIEMRGPYWSDGKPDGMPFDPTSRPQNIGFP